jgi:hypothetical protein
VFKYASVYGRGRRPIELLFLPGDEELYQEMSKRRTPNHLPDHIYGWKNRYDGEELAEMLKIMIEMGWDDD